MRSLEALGSRLRTAGRRAAVGALGLMVALITVEIAGRSLLGRSTLVADEMAGYLLVALGFLGLADSLRAGAFIRVGLVYDRVPAAARRGLDVAILLAALAYTGFLAWEFWELAWSSYRLGERSIFLSRTPLWIPRSLMALGTSLLALELLAQLGDRPGARGAPAPGGP